MTEKTYRIGEAAAKLNLKTYVLRFWEMEFPQISPVRTEKGQRLYRESDLAVLGRIRYLLHERGLTIEGARRLLREESAKGVSYAAPDAQSADFPDEFQTAEAGGEDGGPEAFAADGMEEEAADSAPAAPAEPAGADAPRAPVQVSLFSSGREEGRAGGKNIAAVLDELRAIRSLLTF
jgi:DNA-binding transcriptional MerR regulator